MIASFNARLFMFALVESVGKSIEWLNDGFYRISQEFQILEPEQEVTTASGLEQIVDYLFTTFATLTPSSACLSSLCLLSVVAIVQIIACCLVYWVLCAAVDIASAITSFALIGPFLARGNGTRVRHGRTKRQGTITGTRERVPARFNSDATCIVTDVIMGMLQNIPLGTAAETGLPKVKKEGGMEKDPKRLPTITITYAFEERYKRHKGRRGILGIAAKGPVTIRIPLSLLP